MSYCRFSSDNWRCELYCFADVSGGYTTYVAGNRMVGDIPKEPELELASTDPAEWTRQHRAVMDFLETAEREPIGLKYDGECFHDGDLETFLKRVTMLREAGYNVPDYVFDDIREEIEYEKGGNNAGTV